MSHKSGKKELEHNSSVSSERFLTSLVLFVGRMSHPYPLTETDVLVGDVLASESLDIISSSYYPSSQQDRNPRHDKVERIEWMVLPPTI